MFHLFLFPPHPLYLFFPSSSVSFFLSSALFLSPHPLYLFFLSPSLSLFPLILCVSPPSLILFISFSPHPLYSFFPLILFISFFPSSSLSLFPLTLFIFFSPHPLYLPPPLPHPPYLFFPLILFISFSPHPHYPLILFISFSPFPSSTLSFFSFILFFISFFPLILFIFSPLSSLSLPLILFISFSLCSLYLFFPSSSLSLFSPHPLYLLQSLFILFLAHLSWKLKVSFCDHSPSAVVVVRMSVRPSTIFKQHLLLNHWLDFDQTSQEWSLVGPLSNLFKWFRSIAYLGHRG